MNKVSAVNRSETRSAPIKLRKALKFESDKLKSRSNSSNFIQINAKDREDLVISSRNECPKPHIQVRRKWITIDRLNELRKKTLDAAKAHKTFTVRGCFYSIRNALNARGWVEKVEIYRKYSKEPTSKDCGNNKNFAYDELTCLPNRKGVDGEKQYLIKCERNLISRFLEHMPVDFLWTTRKEKTDYLDQAKNVSMVLNKFHRVPFTSKEGLCFQLKEFYWFYEKGLSELNFPRCYNIWNPEDLTDFLDDFKLTACMSFLRWLLHTVANDGYDAVFSATGKIPFKTIEFAMKRCEDYLSSCTHFDIDIEDSTQEIPKIWEYDWEMFLNNHNSLLAGGGKFFIKSENACFPKANINNLLQQLSGYYPQSYLDGFRNIWIVKPANKCRGKGIFLMDNLKKILSMTNPLITSKNRYVVQKYIERPLIIYKTKFDIRQWFLITSVQPMVIWMYKENYLRFSSQEYNLTNHHESVHLTNHAVQKKYKNAKRDPRLPTENMWDSYSFQAYLKQIGKYDLWSNQIYPGIQRAIIGIMLASQDNMDRRNNTFELFGADFIICERFLPWLIEINSSPDLSSTTSVTARMCSQCLEDVIKVVIDRKHDLKADTGAFELIYRQNIPPTPAYMGLNLYLKGNQVQSKANISESTNRSNLNSASRHRGSIPEKNLLNKQDDLFKRKSFEMRYFSYKPFTEALRSTSSIYDLKNIRTTPKKLSKSTLSASIKMNSPYVPLNILKTNLKVLKKTKLDNLATFCYSSDNYHKINVDRKIKLRNSLYKKSFNNTLARSKSSVSNVLKGSPKLNERKIKSVNISVKTNSKEIYNSVLIK